MFRVGQKVVCVADFTQWESYIDGSISHGPKKNEILIIDFIEEFNGGFYLGFDKYDTKEGYDPDYFRPLDYGFVEEVLEKIKAEPLALPISKQHEKQENVMSPP